MLLCIEVLLDELEINQRMTILACAIQNIQFKHFCPLRFRKTILMTFTSNSYRPIQTSTFSPCKADQASFHSRRGTGLL
jgi:hypothetical protein